MLVEVEASDSEEPVQIGPISAMGLTGPTPDRS